MRDLLCENPPIERTRNNSLIMNALARHPRTGGNDKEVLAIQEGNQFVVNWRAVLRAGVIRHIGKKYWKQINEWAQLAKQEPGLENMGNMKDLRIYLLIENKETKQDVSIKGSLDIFYSFLDGFKR